MCLSHTISSSDVKHIDGGEVLSGSTGEEMVCEAQMTPCGNRKGGGAQKKGNAWGDNLGQGWEVKGKGGICNTQQR